MSVGQELRTVNYEGLGLSKVVVTWVESFTAVFLRVESNLSMILISRFRFAIGVAKLPD